MYAGIPNGINGYTDPWFEARLGANEFISTHIIPLIHN